MVKVIDLIGTTHNFNILGGVRSYDDFIWLIYTYHPKVIFKVHDTESEREYDKYVDVDWFTYYMDLGNGTFIAYSAKDHDISDKLEKIL
ncbi:MAG: hypothetical protein C0180_05760 [Aciduliprofundum sp.]|nr:MAG: hypothetical protein C0180_05760 [Aciduliprofundum sp.]